MNTRQRHAVLLSLIDQLRARGSWCGETHVQKAAYFLQEMLGVPLDLNVILYKHGPYSFELDDELTALQADRLLVVEPQNPYGPKLTPSELVPPFLARYPKTTGAYDRAVQFVADRLAQKTVKELERLATALYVKRANPDATREELASEVHRLKPHVTIPEARAALEAVGVMEGELMAPS